jgi:glutaredoxin
MKKYMLLLGLLLCANAQAGEVFRSIDDSGKVHYSDSPLTGSDDVEELKLDKAPIPNVDLPYETQQAMKNFPVTLYTFPSCGSACEQARALLNKRGIPFTEKSLVKQEDIDAYRKDSGDSQVPAATIGKTWAKGFLEETWNKDLDVAGYPKRNFTYRPPTPAASAVPPTAQ